MDRAPRHSAMVDFQQHCERRWVVLEEDHEKALAQVRAEVEALRTEALRYQWLRDECHLFEHYRKARGCVANFDDEIDAAMSKGAKP